MRALIVEDEPRAASRLERLIGQIDRSVEIAGTVPSVAGAVSWLRTEPRPDLIFMDIQLEDGTAFDIFPRQHVDTPIIFCTAHSEYALRAFAANSIDYLLKPVVRQDLARALKKFRRLCGYTVVAGCWDSVRQSLTQTSDPPRYRHQFVVAVAGQLTPVRAADVLAAISYLKGTHLIDRSGKRWLLDWPLTEVEDALNPEIFFRISRQAVIRLSSVRQLARQGPRSHVDLGHQDLQLPVSRARVSELKKRLNSL